MRAQMMITAFSLALLGGSACVSDEPTTQERLPDAKPVPTIEAPELPSPPSTAPAPMPEQWRAWVDAEVARVEEEASTWFHHVMTIQPKRTRSGFVRLVGSELEDPSAVPVLLHRYLTADESPEVKAAVVGALFRTQSNYAKVVADLLRTEPDALVRVGLVSSLRRVPGSDALAAIEVALADVDVQVRVTAATVAGRHPEGASLATPLIEMLDDMPEVQRAAARSLGYLKIESATTALTELLASPDAGVRLSSLQAIDRIDRSSVEGLSQLAMLVEDADPKVARAAQKIASR